MNTNGRCRLHGGKTPKGLANLQTKVGRYSESLPARLLAKYHAAENDPDLLSTRAEVAVVQTRIMELQERLYTGESASLWMNLKRAWIQYSDALDCNDDEAREEAFGRLRTLIDQGSGEEERWGELVRMMENKTKLAQHEWKRLVDLNQLITAERATIWAIGLLDTVLKHVTDPAQRRAIATDYQLQMDAKSQGRKSDDPDE